MSFDDEDENGAGSGDNSSDNDIDETMEDVDDGDGDAGGDDDADPDAEGGDDDENGDGDNDEDEGDNDEDDDQDEPDSPTQSPSRRQGRPTATARSPLRNGTLTSRPTNGDIGTSDERPTVSFSSPTPRPVTPNQGSLPFQPSVRSEALTASTYDIVPTIAAPHSTSINAVTATPDMRWVFTGGSDGYIRKFNWVDTANGKLMLTVAQRHPFVDSVTKAGVLLSYWDNEESSIRSAAAQQDESLSNSPIYSLAVHHQALWLLSGHESGGINLQTVRHSEGTIITTLRKHTSAVSALSLSSDGYSLLSGSWDKSIVDWDLNLGQPKRIFSGSGGQISAIEPRPMSSLPVPEESGQPRLTNGTLSSNNNARPAMNGVIANGLPKAEAELVGPSGGVENSGDNDDAEGSPDMNSLFGDDDEPGNDLPSMSGPAAEDEDDEFSRAIADSLQQQPEDTGGDIDMTDAGGPVQPPSSSNELVAAVKAENEQTETLANGTTSSRPPPLPNGLPHSEDYPTGNAGTSAATDAPPSSDTTFLDASRDGTLRVWDRRQPNPIARIVPSRSIPPWCMNACWSPDGNSIYAGRRNGTVDEYSLHKGLREPRRTFKFPAGSGPVSAVRAMPNGKHLICASYDILRLYDLKEQEAKRQSVVPFLIVPGHRTGVISQLYLDPTCTFLISTAGNRGWEGASTEVLLGYEIGVLGR